MKRLPVFGHEGSKDNKKLGKNEQSKDHWEKEKSELLDFILDLLISCEQEPSPNGGGGYIISSDQAELEEAEIVH
jgi:hypothetical protein